MQVKYLGLKVAIIFLTIMATPLVWAALAYPEWHANLELAGDSGQAESASLVVPAVAPAVERRIVIVPRYVYTQGQPANPTVPGSPVPAASQQPVAASPPPSAQPAQQRAAAPARSSATSRGS